MNSSEFQAHAEKIDSLVQRVSSIPDEGARSLALDLLRSAMDLHGAALTRIVEVLSHSGEAGGSSLAKLGSDPLICGLLVLYGLHPLSLEDRVKQAIEKLAPQLRKQNASMELVSIADGLVRVRIQASGHGCGSSTAVVKVAEQAILESAPEVVEIVVEGLPSSASGFVPLSTIQAAHKEERKYEKSTA